MTHAVRHLYGSKANITWTRARPIRYYSRVKNQREIFSTYAVATAAKVPMEMSCEGFLRSPLILMPAMTPVNAGKNTPNTLNQSWLSVYPGLLLFFHTVIFHPWNPSSVIQWISGFFWTLRNVICTFIGVSETSNAKIHGT